MPFDYKKEYKEFYLPPQKPQIITVPPMNFAAVQGKGDPNDPAGEYKAALELLYGIAFTIKMSCKGSHKIDGYFEYVVPPLEGLWHQPGAEGVDFSNKETFIWTSMIRLPEFVTRAEFDWAVQEATAKKKKDFSKVEFFTYDEGLCVQCMHIGSYDTEPETLRQLKEQKVDLLHSHCPVMSTILARSIRDVVDAPLVFTYHTKFDVDVAKLLRGRLLQESALYVLASNISACDEVWVVSHGAGENLRSIGYQGDYQVMENGVDMPRGRVSEEAITAATTDYDLPEGVPVFLFVGRMMWYKGLRIILDALKLLQAGGQDFRMVFIGSGADAAEVQEYAKPLGSKCIFTGAISQRETLRAWYCRADLFLFPSSYDTNGLVVREAAACDLAAVLIDGSCAAEGVTDGVDGFLIDENAGSMAAKLQEICKQPECMAQVGCQAGDRLYLSWGDAVKRARERYGIVMENYRMGRYDDHHRPMDGVLNAQGSMMDALAKLRDLGDGLAERYREGWDEHREGIQERRDEFREEFQERLEEHREGRRAFRTELKQKGEALWQKLDRYL